MKTEYIKEDSTYVLSLAAPGATKKDIAVEVANNRLLIDVPRNDVFTGVYRRYTLGPEIQKDQIKAHLKNGVLKITLPTTKPHKIQIE